MTFLDLVNKVIATTGTGHVLQTLAGLSSDSDEALVLSFVQDAQMDLSREVPNAPLQYNGSMSTVEVVDITDCDVTKGSSTVTVSAPTISADWVGRLFNLTRDSQVYRIKSVDIAGLTITLMDFAGAEANYRNTTGTELVAKVAQDRYLLPANLKRPIGLNDFFGEGRIKYMRTEEYDQIKFDQNDGSFLTGGPRRFTIYSTIIEEGDPRFYLEFDPAPDEVRHYPFRYEGLVSKMEIDSDVSGYQDEYEVALIMRARYYTYRYIKMDMNQAQMELMEYQRLVGQQVKSDLGGHGAVFFTPYTARSHYERAYDG